MTKLREIEVEDFLAKSVEIEPMMLEEEFVNLPSQFAYWNARLSEANKTFLRAKIARDQVGARIRMEMKAQHEQQAQTDLDAELKASLDAQKEAEKESGKKKAAPKPPAKAKGPTVDDLRAMTDQHPEVRAAVEAELMAEAEYQYMRGVLEALRTKREMLVSLGAHIRAEMSVNPNMREEARSRHYQE